MKEEALKLADELEKLQQYSTNCASEMIRKLVAELDKQRQHNLLMGALEKSSTKIERPQTKPLSDEEIAVIWATFGVPMVGIEFMKVVRAIEERHGIK